MSLALEATQFFCCGRGRDSTSRNYRQFRAWVAGCGHPARAGGRPTSVPRARIGLCGRNQERTFSHRQRCSSHTIGMDRVNSSSCMPFGCRPSRIASWMSGARSVSRRSLLTKLRVMPSTSAISCADRYLLPSSIRFQRCARASARISVSSCRGFAGA